MTDLDLEKKEMLTPAQVLDQVALVGLSAWPHLVPDEVTRHEGTPKQPGGGVQYRGGAPAEATEAVTTLLLIDEPLTGAGSLLRVRVRLDGLDVEPGAAVVALTIDADSGASLDSVAWDGPVAGRIATDESAYDFGTDGESRLAHRDGSLVAVLRLGTDWVERDASGRELLARLRGIVLFRETS